MLWSENKRCELLLGDPQPEVFLAKLPKFVKLLCYGLKKKRCELLLGYPRPEVFLAKLPKFIKLHCYGLKKKRCELLLGYPRPTVRWERIVSGGRVVLTDNDFFVSSKQTTDNQNLMSGEQWYTLKVSLYCRPAGVIDTHKCTGIHTNTQTR